LYKTERQTVINMFVTRWQKRRPPVLESETVQKMSDFKSTNHSLIMAIFER